MKLLTSLLLVPTLFAAGCSSSSSFTVDSVPQASVVIREASFIGSTPLNLNTTETKSAKLELYRPGYDTANVSIGGSGSTVITLNPTNTYLYNWLYDVNIKVVYRAELDNYFIEPIGRVLKKGSSLAVTHEGERTETVRLVVVDINNQYVVLMAESGARVTYPVTVLK